MATKHQPDRTVGGVTNGDRADTALAALVPYARTVYGNEYGEDLETTVGDMLSNILHYAASLGYDPKAFLAEATESGWGHYIAEAEEELDENEEPSEFLEEPPYDPEEWLIEQPKHFIVHGRTPGDDDDSVAHIEIPRREERSAWGKFVEEILYGGSVVKRKVWDRHRRRHGYSPEGLPDDWSDVEPIEGETTWGEWAYSGEEFEIPGPPIPRR